jgi:hypothetical protein
MGIEPSETGDPIEVPADATVIELHKILACRNAEWAQDHPYKAMELHKSCLIGECVAMTVAWGELVRLGMIDASQPIALPATVHHGSGEVPWPNR